MRIALVFVVLSLALSAGCSSGSSACCEAEAQPEPACGQVLTTCGQGGSIVTSLGAKDGVRPGTVLHITRGSTPIGTVIVHAANETQSAGTAYGNAANGDIRVGDEVRPEKLP